MATPIEISLANLNGGDLMAVAAMELHKICENIADPNVKKDAKRKLQINIEIKPDAKGEMAQLTYNVKSTMPGPDAASTVAYIAVAPGSKSISLFEVESHPPLFENEEPVAGVTPLKPAREA